MWYFVWILGVMLVCSLVIINMLRLEGQEALIDESVVIDPLTELLARERLLKKLQEKVENSIRNEKPFSLLYISLTDFKLKNRLVGSEMEDTLLKVIILLKKDIRKGLDVAAKVGNEDFLLALPGIPVDTAERIANRIKQNIFVNVEAPNELGVETAIGVVEYSHHIDMIVEEVTMGMSEVEALLNIAVGKCLESKID